MVCAYQALSTGTSTSPLSTGPSEPPPQTSFTLLPGPFYPPPLTNFTTKDSLLWDGYINIFTGNFPFQSSTGTFISLGIKGFPFQSVTETFHNACMCAYVYVCVYVEMCVCMFVCCVCLLCCKVYVCMQL